MAHLLRRFGEAALRHRKSGGKTLPALISREEAMQLREQFYMDGQRWPYEHIVPGPPKPPPGVKQYLQREEAKVEKRTARPVLAHIRRQKEIEDAMAKMPKLIEDYRALRRLDWSEVTPLDKLILTQGQIKEKYIKRRLAKS